MKQSSDKYNIAWFKLAEFVARGEKERALGIYRLLTHSFVDQALALQLEADILQSFNDGSSVDRYRQAAVMYEQQERYVESATLYEHIITMQADVIQDYYKVLSLYAKLNYTTRFIEHSKKAFNKILRDHALLMPSFLQELEKVVSQELLVKAYQSFILDQEYHVAMHAMIDKIVDYSLNNHENLMLSSFMAQLEAQGAPYYDHALEYIQKQS